MKVKLLPIGDEVRVISRLTAANYLNKLAADKILIKHKLGTGNFYIYHLLFDLLTNGK